VSVARALGAGWQPSAQLASVAQNGSINTKAQ
jgi:multidrug efflux system outer membrane protein